MLPAALRRVRFLVSQPIATPCNSIRCLPGISARRYATIEELQDQIDGINEKFVEARDEIEYAQEDAETTYFNESAAQAKEAVDTVLQQYHDVLQKLDEDERGKLQRSMGMKMEQLKAEAEALDHLHA